MRAALLLLPAAVSCSNADTHTDDTKTVGREADAGDTMEPHIADSGTVDAGTDDSGIVDSASEEPQDSAGDSFDTDTGSSIDVTLVLNPYDAVDWETWGQYKANFHTHTTNSDGADPPEVVIDQYHSKSYEVPAITDHDYATWPWTDYCMDPSLLGMVAVRGNDKRRILFRLRAGRVRRRESVAHHFYRR